jgi:hypothetical protein
LTNELQPKFEKYVKDKHRAKLEGKSTEFKGSDEDNLVDLVKQLPNAQWFLLSDIGEFCRRCQDKSDGQCASWT